MPTEKSRAASGPSTKTVDREVVAEWPKGPNQIIRVSLGKYCGHTTVNIRVWYQDAKDKTFKPGKNGITLGLDKHASKIRNALKKAKELAKAGEGDDE